MQIVLEKDEFLKAFENLFELGTCAVYNYHLIDSFQAACFISVNVFGINFKFWSYEQNIWRISRSI